MRDYGPSVEKTREEYDPAESAALDFRVGTFNAPIGQTLLVDLGATVKAGSKVSVAIAYQTSPRGTAFSWLTAAQTAGGKLPYMYT